MTGLSPEQREARLAIGRAYHGTQGCACWYDPPCSGCMAVERLLAEAKAEGAREVAERVETALTNDSLWSPLKKALNQPEHAGATLNSIYAVGVILDAVARLVRSVATHPEAGTDD